MRQAGELELADGARLSWSAADGARGRRWRAVAIVGNAITHALLLELDPGGRPTRLELTTPNGLLTLHPSADQLEMHGNIVRSAGTGIEHLRLRWDPEQELDVVGRPLAIAAGLHRRRDVTRVGQTVKVSVLSIDPNLDISAVRLRVERRGRDTWVIAGSSDQRERTISLTADGLPAGGARWDLETD